MADPSGKGIPGRRIAKNLNNVKNATMIDQIRNLQARYDSNGDGIGDLPGITAKLDYIHSIGCDAIWLNPIFESPFGDAGYDVADFYRVAGSRTPMQWSKEKNAGFSTAPADELYLPIDSAESRPNVASEENDPASMLNFTLGEVIESARFRPLLAQGAVYHNGYLEMDPVSFCVFSVK